MPIDLDDSASPQLRQKHIIRQTSCPDHLFAAADPALEYVRKMREHK